MQPRLSAQLPKAGCIAATRFGSLHSSGYPRDAKPAQTASFQTCNASSRTVPNLWTLNLNFSRRTIITTQTNKVAIVTGASGGIGAAVAERLAKDGFIVVVNYAGNGASTAAVVAGIEAAGGRAVAAQADVSDVVAVARMFKSAETAFGGVDVLINNAGIMNPATIADSSDALFDRHIAVNLKGTFNTLREAARRLRDGGWIVNFSSSVTGLLHPTYGVYYGVYAVTKAAVEAITSILAKELRGRNFTVNAIAPRADGDQALPRRQAAGGSGAPCQAGAAGASRRTAGYR